MLLNISSDRIFFLENWKKDVLEYGELEKNLPDFLYSRFAEAIAEGYTMDGKKNRGSESEMNHAHNAIIVINWPGSFTNIRITTLALNTYNTLNNFALRFVSVDKLQRYAILYNAKKIARYCVMYIGQKKNFWFVDLEKVVIEWDKGAIWTIKDAVEMIHVDNLAARVNELWSDWFVDEIMAEAKEMMNSIFGEYVQYVFSLEDVELVTWTFSVVGIKETALLDANYMIDANVG